MSREKEKPLQRVHAIIKVFVIICVVFSLSLGATFVKVPLVHAAPTWPSTWIEIDWDKNENGASDNYRDVQYAFYQYDSEYLYLKLGCYALPGGEWPGGDARYKWFIDFDDNMYYSGGNIYDAEYLLFVEDTNDDATGQIYLIHDDNNDNHFGKYEPWPIANASLYEIIDPNVGDFRVVAPDAIEMCISWTSLGSPQSYGLFWATDQENPNLDQGPTTDKVDEEQVITVHNVRAVSQSANPTVAYQGQNISIQVVVENTGTLVESFHVTCYFNNTIIDTKLVTNLAAAHQENLSFEWNTIGLPVGNYTISAWADSSATIIELDETDNWCTSLTVVTLEPQPVHDVAAVSQVPDQISVVQGTPVNIDVTVSNLGDFSETFNVTCFYSNKALGTQIVASLTQRTSTSIVFIWNTTEVTPNTYYIIAMADSSHAITEVDEGNNNCTSLQTVTVYSPGDTGVLFVDKVQTAVVSGEDPPVVGYATVYDLKIIVSNVGGSTVTNVQVNETVSADVVFVTVGTPTQGVVAAVPPPKIVWNVGNLAPGANATLTLRVGVTPTSQMLLYVNHKEDVGASGIDTLSGNPVFASGITDVTTTPIFRDVAAISQVPSSSSVSQGETVAVDVTVDNLGNVSETFDVTCYYDNTVIGVTRVFNLAAGCQATFPFAWDTTGITPGTYSITARADSSYEIAESNETNNLCTSLSTVTISIHDVAVLTQVPSLTSVEQGETVTIEVYVKNEGTEPETFNVTCYFNETMIDVKLVTALAPNATTVLNFAWDTTSAPVGAYYINAHASVVPGETDTDDNACRSTVSVAVTTPQYQVTFTQTGVLSDYTGVVVTIDGVDHYVGDLPAAFMWDAGTNHTFAYQSPSVVLPNEKRYVWTSTGGLSTLRSGSILVSGAGSVTGNYETQYYLTVTSLYGTPSGEGWYASGATAHAALDTGLVDQGNGTRRVFMNWGDDASGTGYSSSDPITMDGAKTAIATWKTQYLLTVTHTAGGSTDHLGQDWHDAGSPVSVLAIPETDYVLDHWEFDGDDVGAANPYVFNMNPPHTLHAVFVYSPPPIPTYYLTVDTDPLGVTTIPGEGFYNESTNVPLSAPIHVSLAPGSRYTIDFWEVDGVSQGSGMASINVLMDANHTAVAHYVLEYYLTVQTDPFGVAVIPGEGWYDEFSNVPLSAPTVSGYTFLHWNIDGTPQVAGDKSVSVTMDGSHTATANYEVKITVVGGSTTFLRSPYLATWAGANVLILFGILAAAFVRKRRSNRK